MPIHDWTRVEAGIFHDFHHAWISTIKRALNNGSLPPSHYALAERPDALALERPTDSHFGASDEVPTHRTEADIYAAKANRIAVRHVSDHRVVAVIEIVSPGNKSSRGALRTFAEKASDLLRRGVHLLIIDPFPPGLADPQGIHAAIWNELDITNFTLPPGRPLTLASYSGGLGQEAFVEPTAVGAALPDMPLFLTAEIYVQVPLEKTYQSAWDAVPAYWRRVLGG